MGNLIYTFIISLLLELNSVILLFLFTIFCYSIIAVPLSFFRSAFLRLAPHSPSQSPHSCPYVIHMCSILCCCFLRVLFPSVLPPTPGIAEHSHVSLVSLPSLYLHSKNQLTKQPKLLSRILVTDRYGYYTCLLNYITNSRVIFSFLLHELLGVLWFFCVLEYFV